MASKICDFCAVKYDSKLAQCPYCGSTDYKAAEEEYLNQLEDIREDMERLESVPEQETKKAFRIQMRFVMRVVAVFIVVGLLFFGLTFWLQRQEEKELKAELLWTHEHFPQMDELYEAGEYDRLMELYEEYLMEEAPIWQWEHFVFCDIYSKIQDMEELWEKEAQGYVLEDWECAGLLFDQWQIIGIPLSHLDEQEMEVLSAYIEPVRKDFESRWNMSEEDYNAFYTQLEENRGWVTYDSCKEYIEEWYKK